MLTTYRRLVLTAALLGAGIASPAVAAPCPWVAAWGSSQMEPGADNALPAEALRNVTLRQTVRPSIGGSAVRVRFSNAFGDRPLTIEAATLARAVQSGKAAVNARTVTALRFSGKPAW